MQFKDVTTTQQVFVIKGLRQNLLGLPAIKALGLVCRLDAMEYGDLIMAAFPTVFKGLGSFGEPYTINLSPDAKPYALFTPR